MRGNTTTIRLGQGWIGHAKGLYQWDKGQRLIIQSDDLPEYFEVHFANDELGRSKSVFGQQGEPVEIPDEYLTSGQNIHVWVYSAEDDHSETECHGILDVTPRAEPIDEEPTPAQTSIIDELVRQLNQAYSTAQSLVEGIPTAIESALAEAKETGVFDGITPTITIDDIPGGHRITVTSGEDVETFDIMYGQQGDPGNDGYSPTVSVEEIDGGHRITIEDQNGTHTFNVMNGQIDGLIDDEAGNGDYSKVWSADKTTMELNQKADKANTELDTYLSRGRKNGSVIGNASFAFGYDVTASGSYSHGEGSHTTASGAVSHAEGYGTRAIGNMSHAEGYSMDSYGSGSSIVNPGAKGMADHVEGYGTTANSGNTNGAHAEGTYTQALAQAAHAEGYSTKASGANSHAEGNSTTAAGLNSHAEGYATQATGPHSHAEGGTARATNSYAHAEGNNTAAQGQASHAEGSGSIASATASHAEGSGTEARAQGAHVEGVGGSYTKNGQMINTGALDLASHSEGCRTLASGQYAHSEGYQTQATSDSAHAEGTSTLASGIHSHSEGSATRAIGQNSHAEGYYTAAIGSHSHAESYYGSAEGDYSHAEGKNGTAKGLASHVEGELGYASDYAHAQGQQTIAMGVSSHAAGYQSEVYGNYSQAEGYGVKIYSENAKAFGKFNVPEVDATIWRPNTQYNVNEIVYVETQHMLKKCRIANSDATYNATNWENVSFNKALEIVGRGTNNGSRKNARVLMLNGNEFIKGDLYIRCDDDNCDSGEFVPSANLYAHNQTIMVGAFKTFAPAMGLSVLIGTGIGTANVDSGSFMYTIYKTNSSINLSPIKSNSDITVEVNNGQIKLTATGMSFAYTALNI